ncbi:hypothetical protein B6D29_01005 [Microgenomates bacterium UTCPR1]|nr:MAG: hypothetical protein B6D29_01005 [Microgenomates bacterium UTCPR1]
MKLSARQLREIGEEDLKSGINAIKRRPLYFILDNIYDTYNIGGLFRLADALAITKLYICGDSEIPPNHKIKKASIGTYKVVPWEYCETATGAIAKFRESKIGNGGSSPLVLAVEQDKRSVPYTMASYSFPLALVFGNETSGVSRETLKLVDKIVEIPMWGINKSLNVIVSAAIVSYWVASTL